MPAKDRYHDAVTRALAKAGWRITAEQVRLLVEERKLWVDLQIENSEGTHALLVEVKELADVDSQIEALANAVGKIILYRLAITYGDVQLPLYLAVSRASYEGILSEPIGTLALQSLQIPLIVVDVDKGEVIQWIP